jgi:uncharacterized protein with WD repeat
MPVIVARSTAIGERCSIGNVVASFIQARLFDNLVKMDLKEPLTDLCFSDHSSRFEIIKPGAFIRLEKVRAGSVRF